MSASTVTLLLRPKVRDSQLLEPLLSVLTDKPAWEKGKGKPSQGLESPRSWREGAEGVWNWLEFSEEERACLKLMRVVVGSAGRPCQPAAEHRAILFVLLKGNDPGTQLHWQGFLNAATPE